MLYRYYTVVLDLVILDLVLYQLRQLDLDVTANCKGLGSLLLPVTVLHALLKLLADGSMDGSVDG